MKYTFPQFGVLEIEPTGIIVNLETIQDKAISKLISVDVHLVTDTVTYCHRLVDIPYTETWYDDDVEVLAIAYLNDNFRI